MIGLTFKYILKGVELRKSRIRLCVFKNFWRFFVLSFKTSFRRIVATLLVLMTISTFIIVPTYADYDEIDEPAQYYGVVQVSTLNVRQGASMDAGVLATLSYGSRVRVNWIEPGWVCVAYNNDGLMGYVSADYITVYDGEMPQASEGGQAVCDLAAQFLGVPYVWGGTSPSGFDCSGLVQYVYAQLGYSLYRVADDQMKNGIPVSRDELMPGDIIGFSSAGLGGYASHIGIYVGDGMMIHAPHTGDVVKYTSIDSDYYSKRFAGARRIIY